MKSLFTVTLTNGPALFAKKILAGPDQTTGQSALAVAIEAALTAAGDGYTLQGAIQEGGKPVDLIAPAAVAPATKDTPKSLWVIQFQDGKSQPQVVMSNPQTKGNKTTSAADLAIQFAATSSGAVPVAIFPIGTVDIEV